MSTSSASTTSSIVTSAVLLCPASFTLVVAICECSSTIPAVKCFPCPLITVAFPSLKLEPILEIFPFLISTSVFSRIPSFSFVQTVTFLNRMVSWIGYRIYLIYLIFFFSIFTFFLFFGTCFCFRFFFCNETSFTSVREIGFAVKKVCIINI